MAGDFKPKRSWRNIVLDGPYQFLFTIVLVALVAGLMAVLGGQFWRQVSVASEHAAMRADPEGCIIEDKSPAPPPAKTGGVVLDEPTGLDEHLKNAPDPEKKVAACKERRSNRLESIRAEERNIKIALIAAFVMVLLALAVYGLKLTHRVAGPLFKVVNYIDDWPQGKYRELYPLRKKDELSAFYDEFCAAHSSLASREAARNQAIAEFLATLSEEQKVQGGEAIAVLESYVNNSDAKEDNHG